MRLPLALFALPLIACSGDSKPSSSDKPEPTVTDLVPPSQVKVAPLASDQAAYTALREQASTVSKLDAAGLKARYPLNLQTTLNYDPSAAVGLDKIQASRFALTDAERAKLAAQGFVITDRNKFPTFLYGLSQIYSEHLPVFVSADALLEAVHSSYDDILKSIEQQILIGDLRTLLTNMIDRIGTSNADATAKADAELYLGAALTLLDGQQIVTNFGADPDKLSEIFAAAEKAEGLIAFELFGTKREEDFSQFKPRGHYASDVTLSQYFRAQMWLGRVDLRLLETVDADKQVFRRRQYEAMLLLRELMDEDITLYQRIDDVIRTFVGESDYMTPDEVDGLVTALGGAAAARSASDQQVADAIIAGGYGKQLIPSHISFDSDKGVMPLNRSFALLGQRYVVDSQVFGDVTDDRVPQRMMPTPLDAAFAALGNSQALALHPQLDFPKLPGALGVSRTLIDGFDQEFWGANLYNGWLSALRALSPAAQPNPMLPEIATSEAWGRRILNAQLGSWAELRHDTLLYAKQSYSGIPGCEFPDAYVDPYPAFYAALNKYAEQGAKITPLLAGQDYLAMLVTAYFENLKKATSILGAMADQELRGIPFTADQLAYINDAVRIDKESVVCATIDKPNGWFADLYFDRDVSMDFKPTIADVHTQPADEAGNIVGKVLHVGTGYPRLIVTTAESCTGARAYAGVVFAYHELVTEDFERLTDDEWLNEHLQSGTPPADVSWMEPILAK